MKGCYTPLNKNLVSSSILQIYFLLAGGQDFRACVGSCLPPVDSAWLMFAEMPFGLLRCQSLGEERAAVQLSAEIQILSIFAGSISTNLEICHLS